MLDDRLEALRRRMEAELFEQKLVFEKLGRIRSELEKDAILLSADNQLNPVPKNAAKASKFDGLAATSSSDLGIF